MLSSEWSQAVILGHVLLLDTKSHQGGGHHRDYSKKESFMVPSPTGQHLPPVLRGDSDKSHSKPAVYNHDF